QPSRLGTGHADQRAAVPRLRPGRGLAAGAGDVPGAGDDSGAAAARALARGSGGPISPGPARRLTPEAVVAARPGGRSPAHPPRAPGARAPPPPPPRPPRRTPPGRQPPHPPPGPPPRRTIRPPPPRWSSRSRRLGRGGNSSDGSVTG